MAKKARTSSSVKKSLGGTVVTDLFSQAGTAPSLKAAKKSKGKDREEVEIGEDLDRLAALCIMMDALEGATKQLKGELVDQGYEIYAEKASATKVHPSSFVGTGEVSTASFEMRRRGSNAPISDPELIKELEDLGISLHKNVKVPSRYVFDNDLLQDVTIRNAISEAFTNHPTLAPHALSLIKLQPEEYSWCTTEMTLQEAAQKLSEEDYVRIVPFLSSLAIGKFHLDGEPTKQGKKEERAITPKAKAKAIAMLQEMGVLPKTEDVD